MLAEKDARIAQLEAQTYTNNAVLAAYANQQSINKEMWTEIVRSRENQVRNDARITAMERVLGGITTIRVPNSVLCPGVPDTTVSFTTSTSSTTTA